jgi:small-conductance mechanosensitive channel
MPIPLIAQGIQEGIGSIPYAWTVIKTAPWLLLLAALKYYFGGARNTSERLMHSKVVMVTVRILNSRYPEYYANSYTSRVVHLALELPSFKN